MFLCAVLSSCAASGVCGEGLEQVDGRCKPTCSTCGDHERCAKTETTAQCECVAGYAGDPCEWTGGLQNEDFASDESWSKTNGVVILPLETGPSGPGIASFASSVTCNAGSVSQVVEMPSYEDADPFVVEVTFRQDNVLGVDVGYNRAFRRLRATTLDWNNDRFCLGEAGYGGSVKFQVAATERLPECFSAPIGTIEVDSFQILTAEPEDGCPEVGEVANGGADVDGGGWRFEIEPFGPGVSEAALAAGVGESGSGGARIFKPAGSDRYPSMYTRMSVPLAASMPSPALRFWWNGTAGEQFYVDLGTYPGSRVVLRPLDVLDGDGDSHTSTYCLPPWTQGNVVDLSFVPRTATPDDEAELVVDNVELFSDARCGVSDDILDPSFDSAPNRRPGVFVGFQEAGSRGRVINDPGRAHPPGSGLLELSYASNASRVEAQIWVWVPPSEGNRGPQLVFHSLVPPNPGPNVFWAFGAAGAIQDLQCVEGFCPSVQLSEKLPTGLDWIRSARCLPPEWTERWYRFRVAIRPSDDPLETYDPPRTVLLDDFEVTTDEGCTPL